MPKQSTERACPECNTKDTEEEEIVFFEKDRWLLVCPNCYLCPTRVSRTQTSDPWQTFWERRQNSDGRTKCVGGYPQAY